MFLRGTRFRTVVFCCLATWLTAASVAASHAPTVEALLAEQDAELVQGMIDLHKSMFELPQDMVLDPSLREAMTPVVGTLLGRLRMLVPAWIAEERAAKNDPTLRGASLAMAIHLRSLNEMAIASLESAGPDHDEAWLRAATAPGACRRISVSPFLQRIAVIQAAPIDVRPTLIAAERELIARWGTVRRGIPPRPADAELVAAHHAVIRVRAGVLGSGVPMMPFLAGRVFSRDQLKSKPDRWEQCARSQWWLQSQLAEHKADRARALVIYRYSTMPDLNDLLPERLKVGSELARSADSTPGYPVLARNLQVEGVIKLKVSLDNQGQALSATVVSREIRVPGVRNNRPVAFETLLDDASLDFAKQRIYPAGKGREVLFDMTWMLDEAADETR